MCCLDLHACVCLFVILPQVWVQGWTLVVRGLSSCVRRNLHRIIHRLPEYIHSQVQQMLEGSSASSETRMHIRWPRSHSLNARISMQMGKTMSRLDDSVSQQTTSSLRLALHILAVTALLMASVICVLQVLAGDAMVNIFGHEVLVTWGTCAVISLFALKSRCGTPFLWTCAMSCPLLFDGSIRILFSLLPTGATQIIHALVPSIAGMTIMASGCLWCKGDVTRSDNLPKK